MPGLFIEHQWEKVVVLNIIYRFDLFLAVNLILTFNGTLNPVLSAWRNTDCREIASGNFARRYAFEFPTFLASTRGTGFTCSNFHLCHMESLS